MDDFMGIKGRLQLELRNAAGELVHYYETDNLVVTAGKTVIAERLALSSPTHAAMTHMGAGTGATAAAAGDTALQTQLARVALASATPVTNVVTYIASFPAGTATGSITEAGLFNASSSGDMLARSVFGAVVKGSSDSLTITWTLTLS